MIRINHPNMCLCINMIKTRHFSTRVVIISFRASTYTSTVMDSIWSMNLSGPLMMKISGSNPTYPNAQKAIINIICVLTDLSATMLSNLLLKAKDVQFVT